MKKSRIKWKVFVFSLYSVFPPKLSSQKDLLWPSSLYHTILRWLSLDKSSRNLGTHCILIHTECGIYCATAVSFTPGIPPGTWTPTTNTCGITEQVPNGMDGSIAWSLLNCDYPYCLLNVLMPHQTWGVKNLQRRAWNSIFPPAQQCFCWTPKCENNFSGTREVIVIKLLQRARLCAHRHVCHQLILTQAKEVNIIPVC